MSFDAFDFLLVCSVAITLAALLRLRIATFIFAANQIGVLRAFGHLEQFGQPQSQGYLPPSIFSASNLAIAQNLFFISTALLLVCVLLPDSRVKLREPLPAIPRALLWLLFLYFPLVIFSSRTILTNAYSDPERTVYGFNLSGGHAFLASIFLYEIVRRCAAGELSRLKGFGALLLLFTATDYLKGQTGLATGFMVTAAFLVLGGEVRPRRRWLTLGGAILSLGLLSLAVRGVRSNVYSQGTSSFSDFASSVQDHEDRVSQSGEGAEVYGNGSQYAAHVLECISLYEAGLSREWRSVYLPFLYTFQPSFLMHLLDVERPKEAAWELADYYVHGGGIYVLGELYWNGGYLCEALVFGAILLLCWLCDTRARHSFFWLLLLCEFAPGTLQGMGYGFAQVSRGLFNGLLAFGIYLIARKLQRPAQLRSEAHA